MTKTQQRFTVDSEDVLVTGWLEAQKNLSMSIHVLINDYVKRFGSTDAFTAVMSRGLDPEAVQHSSQVEAVEAQVVAPAKPAPAKKTSKPAEPVLDEDTSKSAPAKESTESAPPADFPFSR
ncbi:hypothetical protein JOF28_000309 [Leucobacter exalbidus]|uniref:Uncharacterized protein n=1 Tax=Leucobacter exalbidus TaxID=662960 RepID=A0A940PR39_9MICO|nr:hypothetical protein [Leucobacter exalbidus]MBP1325077.1 hypothetical protein [Leucobacter exalbidus]